MKTLRKIVYVLSGIGVICLPLALNESKLEREVPNYDVISNNERVVNLGTAEEIVVSSRVNTNLGEIIMWNEPCKACLYMAKHPELR